MQELRDFEQFLDRIGAHLERERATARQRRTPKLPAETAFEEHAHLLKDHTRIRTLGTAYLRQWTGPAQTRYDQARRREVLQLQRHAKQLLPSRALWRGPFFTRDVEFACSVVLDYGALALQSPTVRKVFRQLETLTLDDALPVATRKAASQVLHALLLAMLPAPPAASWTEPTWDGMQRRLALLDEYEQALKTARRLRRNNQNNLHAWRLALKAAFPAIPDSVWRKHTTAAAIAEAIVAHRQDSTQASIHKLLSQCRADRKRLLASQQRTAPGK